MTDQTSEPVERPEPDWPITLDEMAARLKVSPRTLRARLAELEAAFPSVSFYVPMGRAKLFEQVDYDRVLDYARQLSVSRRREHFQPASPSERQAAADMKKRAIQYRIKGPRAEESNAKSHGRDGRSQKRQ